MRLMSPEAGQIVFGGYGSYDMSEIGRACVLHLIREIERVYSNVNQKPWECQWRGVDPEIPGIIWNGYRYPDEIQEGVETDGTGIPPAITVVGYEPFGIRWYKYPGRGMSTQMPASADAWGEWLGEALRLVRLHDVKIVP